MNRLFHFLVLIYFICMPGSSFSQQFGGNPPSLKWKQINTDSARIIFPAGLDSQANRVSSIVHYLAAHPSANGGFSLGNKVRKINIVLQNQTTVSNGYVNLGPYRSEFYLTPVTDNFEEGSMPWGDLLALHEYRHVMQYNNFHNGLSNLMYFLFGDDGLSLAINAAIPEWFYEGDAVFNETITTLQGRGRLPLFENAFPSLWKAGKNFSWMKLRNGSLKDYVPNHYYLGYLLVNYGREKYGDDFWRNVTHDASAYKGLFYPFQKAIKKYSGLDYKTFYSDAFAYFKKQNNDKLKQGAIHQGATVGTQLKQASTDIFPLNKKYVTNYYFPYSIGKDSLLYLKNSFRHLPSFFIKNKEGEHKLKVRDISIEKQFSYRNGKIVYAGYRSDPRWGWRDYSEIKILDVQTGEQRTITHKTKYFTPDISEDGSRVAVVQVTTHGRSELHILDASNGKRLRIYKSAEVQLFTDPKFIDDSSLVTAVRLQDGQMALALVDLQSGSIVRLTNPTFNLIGFPFVYKGTIYFTASFEGNDDVFALQKSDKKIYKISDGPLGNYFVNVSDDKITWSAFTADGYQLKQMNTEDVNKKEITVAEEEKLQPGFAVSGSNKIKQVLLNEVPNRNFPVSEYKKGTRLLNFHSWRPYYSDPEFSFSVYGENILNTMQTELYYLYNQNEKTNSVGLNAVYGAWFPFVNVGTEYTFDRQVAIGERTRHWDQLDSHIGLSVPLDFTGGQTYKNFNIGTYYVLRNEFFKDSISNNSFSYLQHFVNWSQRVPQAVQHIYPRAGYSLALTHRHAISLYNGYQFIGNSSVYLPGFFSSHSIVLSGSFQQRDTLNPQLFSNHFAYSRGYEGRYFSRMWRLSANYHFPLFYPDWGFANILYLQRVRANAFYDFTKIYSRDKRITRDQRSVGGEIFIETKWWNQYPLTFGFRVSRLLDPDQLDGYKGTRFEFILPVSIIPR